MQRASQRQNPHRTAHGFGGAGDGVPRFSFPPALGLRLAGFSPEISLDLPILGIGCFAFLNKTAGAECSHVCICHH